MEDDEYDYPASWAELIPEALVLIFTKLPLKDKLSPTFALVCKPWSKVVKGTDCWHHLDFDKFNDLFPDKYDYTNPNFEYQDFKIFIKRRSSQFFKIVDYKIFRETSLIFCSCCGESLRILKIRGAYLWRDVTTFEISVAEKLSCDHLDISCCIIEPSAIRAIGNHCKNLKRLDRNLVFVTDDSNDEDAFAIVSSMPRLKHLEIAYTSVTTKGVFKILSSCPYLQYLDISECSNLTHSRNLFNNFCPGLKVVVDNFVDDDTLFTIVIGSHRDLT
ncbi:F-box protein FBW2-like [Cannabis sativa]|uniref:F-box protein FBW2-like n=1 Tax=Cannabis sativa TaxID=3483 RepID=UPI0029CA6C57|nr:F-box protein FBW2-like [Cannabis sativa]